MLKKFFKIFTVVIIIWGVTFFMILKEYKTSKMVLGGYGSYEKALKRFARNSNNFKNSTISKEWTLLGNRSAFLTYNDQLLAIKDPVHPLGMFGKAVHVKDDVKGTLRMLIKKGWEDNAFNQFVSDLISIDRALPDFREDWCIRRKYSSNLPEVTIIISFHNEAWSTLLRTIHSVLYSSPNRLLREIILVDDFSNMHGTYDDVHYKRNGYVVDCAGFIEPNQKLTEFSSTIAIYGSIPLTHLRNSLEVHLQKLLKVRLVRARRREGLIRSRIIGVKEASTTIVVFLDSHCECTEGWLEPLIERIVENNKTVVSPVIDFIDPSNFEYIAQNSKDIQIGGFNWNLNFIWISIPRDVAAKRENLAAPVKTPTIAGGLFAINKDFFRYLGYYDEKFEIWGAENLELSFKVWMCGGSLEIVPCSHVGHVYRSAFPYRGSRYYFKRNSVRLAEVWLDDYAQYYYDKIAYRKGNFGDVSERRKLRNRLKCKSFDWYLKNVFPDLVVPNNTAGKGQIYTTRNFDICLDSDASPPDGIGPVTVKPCHHQGGHQYWIYTRDGKIKFLHLCLDFLFSVLTLFTCRDHAVTQIWIYDTESKHIRHTHTDKCLDVVVDEKSGQRVILGKCMKTYTQKWVIDNFNFNSLTPELQSYSRKLLN